MNVKRLAALFVAGGALAAWLASASTAGRPPTVDTIRRTSTPVEIHGAALAAEIARLRDRLHPTTPPQAPARNLFQFSRPSPRRAAAAAVAPEVTQMPAPVIVPPPLKLVGIAEDTGPDGAVRTAIISLFGQLFFAKPGERVADRYQVAKISGEAAELIDLNDNSTLTIVLK
jgi:hypothetical protein